MRGGCRRARGSQAAGRREGVLRPPSRELPRAAESALWATQFGRQRHRRAVARRCGARARPSMLLVGRGCCPSGCNGKDDGGGSCGGGGGGGGGISGGCSRCGGNGRGKSDGNGSGGGDPPGRRAATSSRHFQARPPRSPAGRGTVADTTEAPARTRTSPPPLVARPPAVPRSRQPQDVPLFHTQPSVPRHAVDVWAERGRRPRRGLADPHGLHLRDDRVDEPRRRQSGRHPLRRCARAHARPR